MSRQPPAQNLIGPLLIAAGLLVLILMAAVLLWPRPAGTPVNEIPFPEIDRVGLEAARAAQADGSAVIVDVRDPSSYAASHIPGAVSLPLAELDQRLGELDPQAWIITYCT